MELGEYWSLVFMSLYPSRLGRATYLTCHVRVRAQTQHNPGGTRGFKFDFLLPTVTCIEKKKNLLTRDL